VATGCKYINTVLEDEKLAQAIPGELIKCLSVLRRAKGRIKKNGSKEGKNLLEHLKEVSFLQIK
jgi:hypothetical protein